MDKTTLLRLLYQQNPWWEEKEHKLNEEFWPRREQFDKIKKLLPLPQMVLISGLRRTGKTTLLKQTISQLLKRKIHPNRICFFSFEEELAAEKGEFLQKLVETYFANILQKKPYALKRPVFLFLDEIQYVYGWQGILKRYYDINKRIKIILSGSASTQLVWKAKESLAGRLFEIKLPPLSFAEYLRLKKKKGLPYFSFKNPEDTIRLLQKEIALRGEELEKKYMKYLVSRQFPELLTFADFNLIASYLKDSILTKILNIDLPKAFQIKDRVNLQELFLLAVRESGQLVEFQSLSSDLGLSRQKVAEYFRFLEAGFLIKLIFQFTYTRRRMRKQRKVYTTSSNFLPALERFNETNPLFPKVAGNLAETAVFFRLDYLFEEVFFWREREKEVDFVVKKEGEIIPIEVKFKTKIKQKDLKNILYFARKKGVKNAFVLTRNLAKRERFEGISLYFLPAWAI